jgi:hypothetical protein
MKRRLILVVSVLMIVLVALVAWITTRSVPEQSQQLAGGSWLKLEGATYGKSQSFVHGNVWQKLLLGAIPKRFLMKQGPWERFTHYSLQKVGGRLISFAPENDSLVLWTVYRSVKQGWYQDNFIRAVVLDEIEIRRSKVSQWARNISHYCNRFEKNFRKRHCRTAIQINAAFVHFANQRTEQSKIGMRSRSQCSAIARRMKISNIRTYRYVNGYRNLMFVRLANY